MNFLYIVITHQWCIGKIVGSSSSRVKPKTVKLVFAAPPLRTNHLGVEAKTGWIRIRIMCPSEVRCPPADCCFSELAL